MQRIRNEKSSVLGKKTYWVLLHLLNMLFSLSSIMVKFTSISIQEYGVFSLHVLCFFSAYVIILAVYAFFWQKVIKRISLSSAYLSKGLLVIWALFWANLFFSEVITLFNILGAVIIVIGTVLVSSDE